MEMSEKSFIRDMVKALVTSGEKEYQDIQLKLAKGFEKHITRTHQKCSKIKTLLYRDKPVSLEFHYVASDFTCGDKKINAEEIIQAFRSNRRNIVTGTAGSGKSVLLKKVAIDLINTNQSIIPCLIELRLLTSRETHTTITDYLHKLISEQEENITTELLHKALKLGKIFLLLDGFDEIDHEKRSTYEAELLEISNKYSLSPILLSTRPDHTLESLQEFHTYRAEGLTKEQATNLIGKIEYDPVIKTSFIEQLNTGLFEKHIAFTSSPLLLTMLLLTYEQLAEIPEKIHIFYEQAFDTLYHKHDALKDLYRRKSYCNLPIDEFKKIFACFCTTTYYDRAFSFTYEESIKYIKQALNLANNTTTKAENFFKDLLNSVCIIQQEGLTYTFVHRSFQEYFAAVFISQTESIDIAPALDIIVVDSLTDNVISIAFDLNKEKLEKHWILPKLKKLKEEIKTTRNKNYPYSALALIYHSFDCTDVNRGIIFAISSQQEYGFFISCINRLYRKLDYSSLKSSKIRTDANYRKAVNKRTVKALGKSKRSFPLDEMQDDFQMPELFLDQLDWIISSTEIIEKHIESSYNARNEELRKILFSRPIR